MTQKFGTAVAIAASDAMLYVDVDVVGHPRRAAKRRLLGLPPQRGRGLASDGLEILAEGGERRSGYRAS
jgi:hypothetical protein